mgnify:FL=1|jgi:protein-L-isoaspartate(D-aspartate) O-methyltransferase
MHSEKSKFNMIEQQIRTWNVLDESVLDLFRKYDRKLFVPSKYQGLAFADLEIPINANASMLAPKVEAKIIDSLELNKKMKALHIGTGSGFFAALLASHVKELYTVDIDSEFIAHAQQLLKKNKLNNVKYIVSNGFNGYYQEAPYDLIVFTASHVKEPPGLREQLNVGGQLFIFEGDQSLQHAKVIKRLSDSEYSAQTMFEASIPQLIESWEPNKFLF